MSEKEFEELRAKGELYSTLCGFQVSVTCELCEKCDMKVDDLENLDDEEAKWKEGLKYPKIVVTDDLKDWQIVRSLEEWCKLDNDNEIDSGKEHFCAMWVRYV